MAIPTKSTLREFGKSYYLSVPKALVDSGMLKKGSTYSIEIVSISKK